MSAHRSTACVRKIVPEQLRLPTQCNRCLPTTRPEPPPALLPIVCGHPLFIRRQHGFFFNHRRFQQNWQSSLWLQSDRICFSGRRNVQSIVCAVRCNSCVQSTLRSHPAGAATLPQSPELLRLLCRKAQQVPSSRLPVESTTVRRISIRPPADGATAQVGHFAHNFIARTQ